MLVWNLSVLQVGRSENRGCHLVGITASLPPPVEIGLIDLLKSGDDRDSLYLDSMPSLKIKYITKIEKVVAEKKSYLSNDHNTALKIEIAYQN